MGIAANMMGWVCHFPPQTRGINNTVGLYGNSTQNSGSTQIQIVIVTEFCVWEALPKGVGLVTNIPGDSWLENRFLQPIYHWPGIEYAPKSGTPRLEYHRSNISFFLNVECLLPGHILASQHSPFLAVSCWLVCFPMAKNEPIGSLAQQAQHSAGCTLIAQVYPSATVPKS
jgi:hypothetical protein